MFVLGILLYHYFQLKNTIEIKGEIISNSTEKINRGKMTFSVSKTTIQYVYNQKNYTKEIDTAWIENMEIKQINLVCSSNNPAQVYINTFKGLWLEKIYMLLFLSIVLFFIVLFLIKNPVLANKYNY